jgi:hypothetical protein
LSAHTNNPWTAITEPSNNPESNASVLQSAARPREVRCIERPPFSVRQPGCLPSRGRSLGFAPPPRGGFAFVVKVTFYPNARCTETPGRRKPYSAECVEGAFSEVRIAPVQTGHKRRYYPTRVVSAATGSCVMDLRKSMPHPYRPRITEGHLHFARWTGQGRGAGTELARLHRIAHVHVERLGAVAVAAPIYHSSGDTRYPFKSFHLLNPPGDLGQGPTATPRGGTSS